MDASTTALSVARHLKARQGWSQLTVITNGLRIASELAGHPGITVLMLGGRVRWEALSVVGQLGDGLFRRVNVQKAFLGAAGFTPESGLADATEEEAQIKRSMVAAAREVIAIVDHTKWERAAFATFCPTDRLSIILTDEQAPDAMVRGLTARGDRGPAHRPGRGRRGRCLGTLRCGEAGPVTTPEAVALATQRRAHRDLEAVRRDPGPRRRVARPAARRGPRARRRERGREEHAGQDPRRRPPAGQRHDPASPASRPRSRARPTPVPSGSRSSTRNRACSRT